MIGHPSFLQLDRLALGLDDAETSAHVRTCDECRAHFEEVKQRFGLLAIPYTEDPFIVRGLDYYTRTAAEIHSGRLGGAQHQILGGGRYDGLAEQLGGPHTPGAGFGLGIERLMLVLEAEKLAIPTATRAAGLDIFVAAVGAPAEQEAFRLLDRLRTAGLRAVGETTDRGLRAQMKQADRLSVRFAVILGEQELSGRQAGVRDMRAGTQQDVPLDQLVSYLTTAAANGA